MEFRNKIVDAITLTYCLSNWQNISIIYVTHVIATPQMSCFKSELNVSTVDAYSHVLPKLAPFLSSVVILLSFRINHTKWSSLNLRMFLGSMEIYHRCLSVNKACVDNPYLTIHMIIFKCYSLIFVNFKLEVFRVCIFSNKYNRILQICASSCRHVI